MSVALALLQRRRGGWSILAELTDRAAIAAVAPALIGQAEQSLIQAKTDAEREFATIRLALLKLALGEVRDARAK